MISDCVFCEGFLAARPEFFFEDDSGLFAAQWDMFPVRPGHALVIPKRHVRHFQELTDDELGQIARVVAQVKAHILQTDLPLVYRTLAKHPINERSTEYLTAAQKLAEQLHRPPDAFNDGINDGAAAGQTVPHLHWHILPRWEGDVSDPRGGVRHMFGAGGNYHKGLKQ